MLIKTIDELRLASPAHALDSLDGLQGTLDNSEHDFLKDKLGKSLYERLCQWYDDNNVHDDTITSETGYFNRLLLMSQRVIAFDALGRAIGTQIVSVHNSGVNIPTADDYDKPKKEDIDTYRQTCSQEAHAALNRLLAALEEWTQEVGAAETPDTEQQEIVTLWQSSRYYYLAAQLLIPSAVVLQRYLNFYESREKFIQMLPDLEFIQEEVIQPAIGDDMTAMLVDYSTNSTVPDGTTETLLQTTIHRLRKVMAALLAGRTAVLRYAKEQKIQFHDDGVRMLQTAVSYIQNHQDGYPEDIIKTSPLYVLNEELGMKNEECCASEAQPPVQTVPVPGGCASSAPEQEAACWTPPLL